MAILSSSDEAAAILNHYMSQLARAVDLRWSDRNAADIGWACELLAQASDEPPGDEIPPYQPIVSDRRTVVLDRDSYGDPKFERWRAERRADGDDAATRRMIERERGARNGR